MSFGGGWTSGITKSGKVLVERLDPESDEDEAEQAATLTSSTVLKDTVVALYFASSLSENCQSFTPKLKKFYEVVAEREASGTHSVAKLAKARLMNAAGAAAAATGSQPAITEGQPADVSAAKKEDDQAERKEVSTDAEVYPSQHDVQDVSSSEEAAVDPPQQGVRGLEIVFVSSDESSAAAGEHMQNSHGAWLAVPFDDVASREALTKRYVRGGLPALVVPSPANIYGIFICRICM